jgi:hypothetical protein
MSSTIAAVRTCSLMLCSPRDIASDAPGFAMAQAGDECNFAKNESPDCELHVRKRWTPLNWVTVAAIAAPAASSLAGLVAASAAA